MADQVRIDIYLNGDSEISQQNGISGNTSNGNINNKIAQKNINTNKNSELSKYVASQVVGTFLANTKANIVNEIGMVTGRTNLQEKVNLGLEMAQKTTSLSTNILGGMTVATSLGASSLAGGLIGAGIFIATEAINYASESRQLNIARNIYLSGNFS